MVGNKWNLQNFAGSIFILLYVAGVCVRYEEYLPGREHILLLKGMENGGKPFSNISRDGKYLSCICVCFDKNTQYHVDFTRKLQKNTCNIRSIAIIYSKDRFEYYKQRMDVWKEQFYVNQWYL